MQPILFKPGLSKSFEVAGRNRPNDTSLDPDKKTKKNHLYNMIGLII